MSQLQHGQGENRSSSEAVLTVKKSGALQKRFVQVISYSMLHWRCVREVDKDKPGEKRSQHPIVDFLTQPVPTIKDDIFDNEESASSAATEGFDGSGAYSNGRLDKDLIETRLKTHLKHFATILESPEVPAEFEYYTDPSSSVQEPIAHPSPVFRNHVSRALTLAARDYLLHKDQQHNPLDERDESGIQKFRAVIIRTMWEVTQLVVGSVSGGQIGVQDPMYHPGLTVLCHCMLNLKSKWDRQDGYMTTINDSENGQGNPTGAVPEYVEVDADAWLDKMCEECHRRMQHQNWEKDGFSIFISLPFLMIIAEAFGCSSIASRPRLELMLSLIEVDAPNPAQYMMKKLFVEKGLDVSSLSNILLDELGEQGYLENLVRVAKSKNCIGKTLEECVSGAERRCLCIDALTGLFYPSRQPTHPEDEKTVAFPFENYSSSPSIPAFEAARVAMLSFFVTESTSRAEDLRQKHSTVSTVRASYTDEQSDGLKKSYERLEGLGKMVESYREKLCQLVLRNLSSSDLTVDEIFPRATNETCRKRILIGDSRIAEALNVGDTILHEGTSAEALDEAREFCSRLLEYSRSPEKPQTNAIHQLLAKERFDLSVTFAGTDLRLQMYLVDTLTNQGKINEAEYLSNEFELARRVGTVVTIFEGLNAAPMSASDITYSPQWFDALKNRKHTQSPKPFTSRFGCNISTLLRTFPSMDQDQSLNIPMIFYDSISALIQNSTFHDLDEPIQAVGQPKMTVPVVTVSTLEDVNRLADYLRERVHAVDHFTLPIVGLDVEWRPNNMYDSIMPSYDLLADIDSTDPVIGSWKLPRRDATMFEQRYNQDLLNKGTTSFEWPASILQLATNELTILVDLLALQQDTSEELDYSINYAFGDLLLRTSSVYVVGHGVSGDLQKIVQTHPRWHYAFSSGTAVIDVRNLPVPGDGFTVSQKHSKNAPRSVGLAKLVEQILGLKLRKNEQTSDWHQRPLSAEQKRYGAIDAFVGVALVCSSLDMQAWRRANGNPSHEALLSISEDVAISPDSHSSWRQTLREYRYQYTPALDLDFIEKLRKVSKVRQLFKSLKPGDSTLQVRLVEHVSGQSAYESSSFIGTGIEQIVKTLAFTVAGQDVVVLVPGHLQVDSKKLSRLLGVSPKRVRLAPSEHCEATYGYIPGEFPPVGFPVDTHILIDESLKSFGYVYGGGGTRRHMLITDVNELLYVNTYYSRTSDQVRLADVSKSAKNSKGMNPSSSFNPDVETGLDHDVSIEELWKPPKFLADSMLGRLVRWLRVIGVDCMDTQRSTPREEMIKQSVETDRILLTRDYKLVARKDTYLAFFVEANDTADQFKQVTEHFGIVCSPSGLMSRCAKCNGEGYYRLDRDTVRQNYSHIVHEKVLQTVEEYWQCRSCGKLYWEGPKFYDTREKFEAILHEYEKTF